MGSNLDAAAKLAVAQAVYKVVGAAVSTKERDNLRAQLDDETVALYQMYGSKNRELKIGNMKVGSISVVTESRAQVAEPHDWNRWKVDTGRAVEVERVDWDVLSAHERELVIAMVKGVNAAAVHTETVDTCKDWTAGLVHDGRGNAVDEDGCIVPGVRWVDRVKYTTVKGCDPSKVMAALHALPEPVNVMGLLMGGGDE